METDDDLIKAYRFNSTTVNLLALLAKRDRDDPHVLLAKAGARLVIDQMGVEKSARLINHVIECLQSNPPSCLAPKSSKPPAKTPKKLEVKGAPPAAAITKGSSGRSKNGEESFPYFNQARLREFGDRPINLGVRELTAKLSKRLRELRDRELEQNGVSGIPQDLWKGKTYQRYRAHLREIGLLPRWRGRKRASG
jgi:hypothetical protein